MEVLETPTFKRATKKLKQQQRLQLVDAVREIAASPEIGKRKLGDLRGVYVHKFRIDQQLTLFAYEWDELSEKIYLLDVGSHQNFYRDLKN